MAIEIERKFLVTSDDWRQSAGTGSIVQQGYLCDGSNVVVRVRTMAGKHAFLTIKSAAADTQRLEFEYEIPMSDAHELLRNGVGSLIEKTRYVILEKHHKWEVDVFSGANLGLVIAEIELATADQVFDRPTWLGREVTGDPKYYNSRLAQEPYSKWDEASADDP